jgi:hypothetical protein
MSCATCTWARSVFRDLQAAYEKALARRARYVQD